MSIEAFRRGLVLLERARFAEAEPFMREALAGDPQNGLFLHHLAYALNMQEGEERNREALELINHALGQEPDDPEHHLLKAEIVMDLGNLKAADACVEEAFRFDPESAQAWTMRALVRLRQERWAEAEEVARRALALDLHNPRAHHALIQSLRMQGKKEEDESLSGMLLAENPENDHAQANAGWSKLRHGDPTAAETHFLEALRINPSNEYARQGMKESFRSRSRFYHAYLRFSFWMAARSEKSRWGIIIGLYIAYRLLAKTLVGAGFYLAAGLLVALYLAFVCWSFWSPAFGNLALLKDRRARHALTPGEKSNCLGVLTFVVLALLSFSGLLTGRDTGNWVLAGMLFIAASFPFSLAVPNRSSLGQMVFGLIALHGAGVAALCAWEAWEPARVFSEAFLDDRIQQASMSIFLGTLLGGVKALRG